MNFIYKSVVFNLSIALFATNLMASSISEERDSSMNSAPKTSTAQVMQQSPTWDDVKTGAESGLSRLPSVVDHYTKSIEYFIEAMDPGSKILGNISLGATNLLMFTIEGNTADLLYGGKQMLKAASYSAQFFGNVIPGIGQSVLGTKDLVLSTIEIAKAAKITAKLTYGFGKKIFGKSDKTKTLAIAAPAA